MLTAPVPLPASITSKFAPPPVADNVGPVVEAPFAIVNSFTALDVAVNLITSFPLVSFNDVPNLPVFIIGDVSVLLVKVSVPAFVAIIPPPVGTVRVPLFVIDAITGVVSVLLVSVSVLSIKDTVPVAFGNVTVLSAVGSVTFRDVSLPSGVLPSNITPSVPNVT